MFSFHRSFYAQIATIFLLMVLLVGVAIAVLGVRSSLRFVEESQQKVSAGLADQFAREIQPFLIDSIYADSIRNRIQYLKGINPQVDLYLISSDGTIKDHYLGAGEDSELYMAMIDTEPLRQFIDGAELPILGEDPINPKRKKPFSATNISIMGSRGCFLYVVLKSQEYDEAASMAGDSYILQNSLIGLGLILFGAVVVGLTLFRRLTRRIDYMKDVVCAFESGQLDKRYKVQSKDEIADLGKSFNQMADTLVANMDEIRKVDKLRRELVANVSHDLRSPLSSIQGYLETILMKEDSLSADERKKYLNIVLSNTQKLNNLVNDLFELSKLDASEIEVIAEPVAPSDLLQDLLLQFDQLAQSKKIKLTADIPQDLPLVKADIALMERAIGNLLDNAIKHTPEGGSVSITPVHHKGVVTFKVTDTGVGISEADQDRIFDRFYQADQSRGSSGAGLGLSISQKILELHGSELRVKSALKKGTEFSFSLQSLKGP